MKRVNTISGKAYGKTLHPDSGEQIILPIFDELVMSKTSRKKIQIIVSGEYKKGVPNNEKSPLYQIAKQFFDQNGFSFGVEISLLKNIPEHSGFSEESGQKKILIHALEIFSEKWRDSVHRVSPEKTPTQNIEIILFPEYKIPEDFLDQMIQYRNISAEECVLECFYEVQKKHQELLLQKKKGEISEFGLIGNGANIWVRKER